MALWQTRFVVVALQQREAGLEVDEVVVSTVGDRRLDLPISALGGKGSFAKEVQHAVLDGRADIAVHSGKDLPARTPDGLVVAAVLERHDPRDALIGSTLDGLRSGAVVATGSPRRRVQLAQVRPDLRFAELRGNVGTRLSRVAEFDALVLAAAGLDRLGRADVIAERLDPAIMVPQVAQGVLAIECRVDDAATRASLAAIDHVATRALFEAERSFLIALGGDCDLPAGAHAVSLGGGAIRLEGVLGSPDGRSLARAQVEGDDGPMLGARLLERLNAPAGSGGGAATDAGPVRQLRP